MLSAKQLILRCLGGILLGGLAATPAFAGLSVEEINSIARQTTVLIAPGLTPELIQEIENNRNNPLASEKNKEGVWNPGSGVIVARQGKTYYVLTVAHNFPQRFVGNNTPFGIRTWDRQVHQVKQINDSRGCPLSGNGVPAALVRFGCRTDNSQVLGMDIAVVSFESDKDYAVASLGNADEVNIGETVYISGWPDPEKELDPETGKCRGKVARRQRRLAWGPVAKKINPNDQNTGYSIFYTDNTRAGMSGGPVFDSNGRLVGNHGQGSGQKIKRGCSASPQTLSESEAALASGTNPAALPKDLDYTGLTDIFSSSQQVNFALELIKRVGLNLPFNFNPPSAELISNGQATGGMQAIAQASGKVEFDAKSDAFEDPKDEVDDIYQLFSFGLKNQLRLCPSGGQGSLLIDDRCE
ncbi:MAG: serine protease [Oscillatoria princeps RMCB-10]|jgi:hypothetical protein|nr:serine protease [Oscillatoria princeps RMCB-10]